MKARPISPAIRRQRPPIGYLSCVLIVGVAMAIIMRFAWKPLLMLVLFAGVTSVSAMVGVIVGLVIVAAASLHAKLNGRAF